MAVKLDRSRMISFKIPDDQRTRIDALATLWDVPMSVVVRHLLEVALTSVTTDRRPPFTTIRGET